jgi:uncharacterized protein (DUF2147 family)
MAKIAFRLAALSVLPFLAAVVFAQGSALTSPAGRWKTIDDATGKAKAIVVVREENGKLYGKVEKVLDSDQPGPNPLCLKCEGALRNLPITGLQVLWDLKKDGAEWTGGQILDPHNGKVYRCIVALDDAGRKLKVRGYIGIALIGRTEYWQRIE